MRHATRSLSFLWILSALAVGACAVAPEAPDGGLPPLTLSAANDLPEVTIHPTQVTVKNGRGETLLDGAPDRDYRLSGNPRAGQFDGTLNITTVYDNGTTKTQTLTHDPARRVKLEWDPRQKQYVVSGIDAPTPADARPAPGEPGWAIQAFGDFKRTPYDATTVRSSGSNTVGSPDLSDRMGSLGVGLRRYFATTGAGIQPFAYAGFSEYFGNGVRGADVTYHFGATPDTGGEIKEERSFLAGVGGYMQL
ncbi:MAG: hypothetical protein KIT73_18635, partial [Burkholderiales bacterium]|nr:hypothetical protein [Burkholderiales bacterium]